MDKKTIECSVCSGKGFIPCKTCGGNTTVKCPDCGGEGREYKIICHTCHKGYVTDTRSLDDDKTLCPDCHGNYREDLGPCKKCDGKGVLSCESCNGTGKTECTVCKGKGKISFWDFIEVVHLKDVDEFVRKYRERRHEVSWQDYKERYERARSLFEVYDVTPKVWKEMLHAAQNGDGVAAFALGMCYAKGIYHGNKQDLDYEKMAASWFKKSAEAGIGYGQFLYGRYCLYHYWSTRYESEEKEGNMMLEKAGEQNVVMALVDLALRDMNALGRDNELSARRHCRRILDVKDHGGECDDGFYEFAKAHDAFLTKIIARKSARSLRSVCNDMQKWWRGEGMYTCRIMNVFKDCRCCRREFVRVGIFFGLLGLQFVYARRWKFFFAYWAALITTLFFPLAFIVCLVLWFGSVFFMKRDGEKVTMD